MVHVQNSIDVGLSIAPFDRYPKYQLPDLLNGLAGVDVDFIADKMLDVGADNIEIVLTHLREHTGECTGFGRVCENRLKVV